MSCERLDKAAELYKAGVSRRVIALGGPKSTYRPNAIEFKETGGHLRRQYLLERGVLGEAIITIAAGCQDTIGEALAVRELGLKRGLVVTSKLHLPRALYLFKRIHGSGFEFSGKDVPSDGILIAREESEYLNFVRSYFARLPEVIPERNFDEWYENHPDYYAGHLAIHDTYHSGGRESQAYSAVN